MANLARENLRGCQKEADLEAQNQIPHRRRLKKEPRISRSKPKIRRARRAQTGRAPQEALATESRSPKGDKHLVSQRLRTRVRALERTFLRPTNSSTVIGRHFLLPEVPSSSSDDVSCSLQPRRALRMILRAPRHPVRAPRMTSLAPRKLARALRMTFFVPETSSELSDGISCSRQGRASTRGIFGRSKRYRPDIDFRLFSGRPGSAPSRARRPSGFHGSEHGPAVESVTKAFHLDPMNAEMDLGTNKKAFQINLDRQTLRNVCRNRRRPGSGAALFSGRRRFRHDRENDVGLRHAV